MLQNLIYFPKLELDSFGSLAAARNPEQFQSSFPVSEKLK